MTMPNTIASGKTVSEDADLQRALDEAVGGQTGDEAHAQIAAFATARGFAVTPDEVAQALAALSRAQDRSAALSDVELETISGGKPNPLFHNAPTSKEAWAGSALAYYNKYKP